MVLKKKSEFYKRTGLTHVVIKKLAKCQARSSETLSETPILSAVVTDPSSKYEISEWDEKT